MLQSLLSSPEPKDPQDAEVATMLLKNPDDYNHKAREWAVEYAGAPRRELTSSSKDKTEESAKKLQQQQRQKEKEKDKDKTSQYVQWFSTIDAILTMTRYKGYSKRLIDRFCSMGFDIPQVVAAFEYVGIDRNDGEDYELEEAYIGDITARLFGEP
jgi:ubiquitin-conjugating enzyme (huntingtin interacting protein 2)